MEHLRKLAFALVFLTVVMSTVWTSAGALKVIRVAGFLEDQLVTQDITDDPERNTVLIVVGEVTNIEDFKSTVNLHDFNTGYVALKDVADGTCLLKPIPFDKKEHIPGLRDYVNIKGTRVIPQQKKMYWDVDPKVLTYNDVKKQAGDTLAEFCRDYRSYNLVPKSSKSIGKLFKGTGSPRMAKRCVNGCGICFNAIDGYEDDQIDTVNID